MILCLLDVARYAERVGITPPELVRMEREIEEMEELSEKESSPLPWEEGGEEKQEGQKCDKIKETTADASKPITPPSSPSVQLETKVTPSTSETSKKTTLSDPKEKIANATIITPEHNINYHLQLEKLPASSRKLLFTPSRIPVPISGTTRAHHNCSQTVQSASRQLRKRRREEEDPSEDGHRETREAKKLKISPPVSESATLRTADSLPGVKKVKEEEKSVKDVAVERRHESMDEKVRYSLEY